MFISSRIPRCVHSESPLGLPGKAISSLLGRYGSITRVAYAKSLPNKQRQARDESTVVWVTRSLTANGVTFTERAWFVSANDLRNLIAHSGGWAGGCRAEAQLKRSRLAFPSIDTWQDGYVDLTHEHVAELQGKIEDFIRETGR